MWYLLIVLIMAPITAVAPFGYGPGYGFGDERIYTFAFAGLKPGAYFNGQELVGARVELMKEVCCRASKRCETAFINFDFCYNSDGISQVLNNRWYDVCLEISDPPIRRASYAFSDIDFYPLSDPIIITSPDSKITLEDLKDARHDIKVAFLSNKELATSGIIDVFLQTYFIKPENMVPVLLPGNRSVDDILELINDPCSGVEVGIVPPQLISPGDKFKTLGNVEFELGNVTMMVRKDDQGILEWWDFTLKNFMCSDDYKPFCERLDQELGPNPFNCPDVSQLDCNTCSIDRRVPACGCRK